LKAFETIHFHHVYGMMDRDLFEGWHGLLRHYVFAPGMAHYWKLRPEVFSERFRTFVRSLQPPTDQRTVGTLFKESQSGTGRLTYSKETKWPETRVAFVNGNS